jgi:hypothetical protein
MGASRYAETGKNIDRIITIQSGNVPSRPIPIEWKASVGLVIYATPSDVHYFWNKRFTTRLWDY